MHGERGGWGRLRDVDVGFMRGQTAEALREGKVVARGEVVSEREDAFLGRFLRHAGRGEGDDNHVADCQKGAEGIAGGFDVEGIRSTTDGPDQELSRHVVAGLEEHFLGDDSRLFDGQFVTQHQELAGEYRHRGY